MFAKAQTAERFGDSLFLMVESFSAASFDRGCLGSSMGFRLEVTRTLGRRVSVPANPVVPATNRLLAALPGKDRDGLMAQCEPIELIFAE